jgi:hypothetical protein
MTIASDHSSACDAVAPMGWSSISPRTALDSWVTGLTLTHACSQPGSLAVGTKMLLPNVSGNRIRNAYPWTLVGVLASSPMIDDGQLIAKENSTIRPIAASTASTEPCSRKPRMNP